MINKIKVAASAGALLLAVATPAFAWTLPNINGQVNYVESQSAAGAYTGGNVQLVSGGSGTNTAAMRTGDAYAQSLSSVGIVSRMGVNGGGSCHDRCGSGINLGVNVAESGSGAEADSGFNTQSVGGEDKVQPSFMTFGGHHSGGNTTTSGSLTTGDASAVSQSSVSIVSALNVTSSRRH